MVAEGRGSGVSTSAGTHTKGFLLDNAPESRGVARQQIVPVFVCVGGGGRGVRILLTWLHLDRDVDVRSVGGREQGRIVPSREHVNNSASLRADWVANTVN